MPRAWREVGTPGHSVCTQLDHPHKNESLHHGSPLSEFMSAYHSQELSTFTPDFHTWILGSAVLCPTLSYGKFSVVRGKRIPMHLMGSLPEKKLENCPCIISLSLARVTLTHTMPPIVHSKPKTGRLPRAACLTPRPNTSTGKPHVHTDPTRTGRFRQQGFAFRCMPPGYLAAIQRELQAVHLASHIQQYCIHLATGASKDSELLHSQF